MLRKITVLCYSEKISPTDSRYEKNTYFIYFLHELIMDNLKP
jgi:hypothetical protein